MTEQPRTTLDGDRYAAYLNQHLVASDSGINAFRAAAQSWHDTPYEDVFATIADELEDSRAHLIALIERLGYSVSKARNLVSGAAEAAGRINPLNPTRSSDGRGTQMELDSLVGAVRTQAMMWETLEVLLTVDPRLDAAEIAELLERCRSQRDRVRRVSAETAVERFTADPEDR